MLLNKMGTFSEEQCVYLSAQVILGLEYLHEDMDVIYRDLKPENIMMTSDGHVKLTDFGLSKHMAKQKITYTFAGTPEYLAPEVILKQGHSKVVDMWSLGILIF